MKSKLAAFAACLLLGGLLSMADAQSFGPHQKRKCVLAGGVISCGTTFINCHCNSGTATVVTPQPQPVGATWCRDRGAPGTGC